MLILDPPLEAPFPQGDTCSLIHSTSLYRVPTICRRSSRTEDLAGNKTVGGSLPSWIIPRTQLRCYLLQKPPMMGRLNAFLGLGEFIQGSSVHCGGFFLSLLDLSTSSSCSAASEPPPVLAAVNTPDLRLSGSHIRAPFVGGHCQILCPSPLPAWLPDGRVSVLVDSMSAAQRMCGMNEEVLELCGGNTVGNREPCG